MDLLPLFRRSTVSGRVLVAITAEPPGVRGDFADLAYNNNAGGSRNGAIVAAGGGVAS